jgi:small ligand-binding sensory domain FIST
VAGAAHRRGRGLRVVGIVDRDVSRVFDVNRFAAGLSEHPVPAHAVGEVAGEIMESLGGDDPDLVMCFASPHFVGALDDVAFALGNLLSARVSIGASAVAVIGGPHEVEHAPAISVFAASLPGAELVPVFLHAGRGPDGFTIEGLPQPGVGPGTLFLLADPFTFPLDGFLRRFEELAPEVQVVGGAASAARGPGGNRLVLDGAVHAQGAVGVLVRGVGVRTVVSQGCRPVGTPLTVTRAHGTVVEELAGLDAVTRLQECAADASEEDRMLMGMGLHLGIVVDEHQMDFEPGDFLVRAVTGADPGAGSITVGDTVEIGQTVQFHVRDAAAADEDLRTMLAAVDPDEARGALLFSCNGRGERFFGEPDHDAAVVDQLLGPLPTAGMFCAGEVGPVGGRSFLHAYTASLALFS